MGYYTRVDGEIRIDPPLTATELRALDIDWIEGGWRSVFIRCETESRVVELVDALPCVRPALERVPITVLTGVAIVAPDDELKAYRIVEHLQELVDLIGPGHSYAGRLEGVGEEQPDMWRLYVRDGRAVRVEPRIVWPDDEQH